MDETHFESTNFQLQKSKWNRVNWFSKLFFLWLWPLYYKAFRHNKLQFEDVFTCPPVDRSEDLVNRLERNWKEELSKSGPKAAQFRRALFATFVHRFIPILLSFLFQELIIRIGQAYLLGNIINYFAEAVITADADGLWSSQMIAIYSAIGFVVCAALGATLNHFNITLTDHVGLQMKIACSTIIYKQVLRLSQKALHETSVGQVSNLLANDVNRMVDYAYFAHSPIVAPLQLAIVTYLLWRELSWSCLLGLALLFCFIPIQGLMGRIAKSIRSKTALLTDQRIRIISEIIGGIKLIKMYAWERIFLRTMAISRIKEVKQIRASCNLKGVHLSMYYVTSRIVLFICFISYVYLFSGTLTAHKVFVAMALFNVVRIPLTRHLPQSIAATAELIVTCRRIQKFLLLEQVHFVEAEDEAAVIVENASASWDVDVPTFREVNFTLKKGELLCIVGPVGSGKSSILLSLMQELPVESGRMVTFGSIAYVPQKSWVFMGSILENILFGRPFEEKRFWEVVKACALDADLARMPLKEATLVGERGYKLSGGQKARISLARALYSEADIYLLDDPISALDAKVARSIVEKCLLGYLQGKTCILATHQVQFVPQQASVLILDGQGEQIHLVRHDDEDERCQLSEEMLKSFEGIGEKAVQMETAAEIEPEETQMTRSTPYRAYLRYGFHPVTALIILLFTLVSQALSQGCDYLLSKWTEDFSVSDDSSSTNLYAYLYTGFIVALFFSTLLRATSFFSFCMSASTKLYNRSFDRLIRSPIQFFYHNPAGRILNRVSRDIGILDDYIPMTAFELQMSITDVIATLIIEIIINWTFLFPAIVFLLLMWAFSVVYLKTARELKRLEAIARNPIFSHMNTTFDGLTVIRCFTKQTYFEQLYYRFQDFHTSVYFSHICATRGFAILIEWLCVVYIAAITTLAFYSTLNSSLIGLSLSSCILLVGVTSWGVECCADLESQMSSVERIAEYCQLPVEFDTKLPVDRSLSPIRGGKIVFSNVILSYGDSHHPVLNGLNFTIRPRERVGIVGRTGSGKSSLIAALFRLVDTTGDIFIDDVNICDINLELLRSSISSIPQDPVLFTGTIRSNIDLFDQFTDSELWQALEEVQLKSLLVQSNRSLYTAVHEGGANFSVGQRQLLCLARAMLQRRTNHILINDEATSDIDSETDQAIQRVIREKFNDCTVITVAHRLNTIIDCDLIMVLDNGQLVEMGRPHRLLSQNSTFASLVDKMGPEMARQLRQIAKTTYLERHLHS